MIEHLTVPLNPGPPWILEEHVTSFGPSDLKFQGREVIERRVRPVLLVLPPPNLQLPRRYAPENPAIKAARVAALLWNEWQASPGMGGNFRMESVADSCQWQLKIAHFWQMKTAHFRSTRLAACQADNCARSTTFGCVTGLEFQEREFMDNGEGQG